ncbi:MAG: response regulator, partial [Verrucomicrobiales bacterium]|nr:response regulator [Verrucomicrobiales bacterium]
EKKVETPTRDVPRLKLLLVEDGRVNQIVATQFLEEAGHHVVLANNGIEALEKLKVGTFDGILMDMRMPEMDGYETTTIIRESEKKNGTHIPIIAMTANAMEGDRENCLSFGMDDYLAKPVRAEALYRVLERNLISEKTGDQRRPNRPGDVGN